MLKQQIERLSKELESLKRSVGVRFSGLKKDIDEVKKMTPKIQELHDYMIGQKAINEDRKSRIYSNRQPNNKIDWPFVIKQVLVIIGVIVSALLILIKYVVNSQK